jgi:hypothetical protein
MHSTQACSTTYPDERLRTMTWQTVYIPISRRRLGASHDASNVLQDGDSQSESEDRGTAVEDESQLYSCWSARCTQRGIPVGVEGYRSTNVFVGKTMEQPRLHSLCYDSIFWERTPQTGNDRNPPSRLDRGPTVITTSSGSLLPPSNRSQG